MKYSDLHFSLNTNKFSHNLGVDYSYFALWKPARPFISEIREYLHSNFKILLETEITWSEAFFEQNAARLYEIPIFKDGNDVLIPTNHTNKIGDTTFVVFVVKDSNPEYSYAPSISGNIELSNLSIVKAKYYFRDMIFKEAGVKYAIHSTNNIFEFFFQAPLIFGVSVFKNILEEKEITTLPIKSDLLGAGGWKDYKELFEVIDLTSNYLIMRNFDTLPFKNEDKDLDILTDNYQRFASAVGATQSPCKPYKASIVVNGKNVPLDIRFVGDGYYCTQWQKDMLETKKFLNGVYVPREDHYFFSLLYHAKVQKPQVKNKYAKIFQQLSNKLNFNWFNVASLEDKNARDILKGYLKSSSYFYSEPIDTAVYKNHDIINFLPQKDNLIEKLTLKQKSKKLILKILPESFYRFYLKQRTKG